MRTAAEFALPTLPPLSVKHKRLLDAQLTRDAAHTAAAQTQENASLKSQFA